MYLESVCAVDRSSSSSSSSRRRRSSSSSSREGAKRSLAQEQRCSCCSSRGAGARRSWARERRCSCCSSSRPSCSSSASSRSWLPCSSSSSSGSRWGCRRQSRPAGGRRRPWTDCCAYHLLRILHHARQRCLKSSHAVTYLQHLLHVAATLLICTRTLSSSNEWTIVAECCTLQACEHRLEKGTTTSYVREWALGPSCRALRIASMLA